MVLHAQRARARFDPNDYASFRFLARSIDRDGRIELRYGLDDAFEFVERLQLPVPAPLSGAQREGVQGLLALLHWVAGVSYYKTAAPRQVAFAAEPPPPAAAALLDSLYSEGLGEFAYTNGLAGLPHPRFGQSSPTARLEPDLHARAASAPRRVLVPIGGGKDSAVAVEIVRAAGVEVSLFSIGDAPPIVRTVRVAGLPHLIATRTLDPELALLNRDGALNGHVPVTAIVSCAAALCAAIWGHDSVAMANERSASSGNVVWDGVEVNHQFSKSLRAELLIDAAVAEASPDVRLFSVLRRASELAIARAFARMEGYHPAFTSCNAIFRLDPQLRSASWCCDCPKCRFVYLVLAPFTTPDQLRAIFGADLLDDERQYEGFALLTATGGHKPFECVGEEQESIAALRLLAEQPRWRGRRVLERLLDEVLSAQAPGTGDPATVLALGDDHAIPESLLVHADALLRA